MRKLLIVLGLLVVTLITTAFVTSYPPSGVGGGGESLWELSTETVQPISNAVTRVRIRGDATGPCVASATNTQLELDIDCNGTVDITYTLSGGVPVITGVTGDLTLQALTGQCIKLADSDGVTIESWCDSSGDITRAYGSAHGVYAPIWVDAADTKWQATGGCDTSPTHATATNSQGYEYRACTDAAGTLIIQIPLPPNSDSGKFRVAISNVDTVDDASDDICAWDVDAKFEDTASYGTAVGVDKTITTLNSLAAGWSSITPSNDDITPGGSYAYPENLQVRLSVDNTTGNGTCRFAGMWLHVRLNSITSINQ